MRENSVLDSVFTAEEQTLLIEILEQQRKQIAVEIRHTDSRQMRELLGHRLAMIDGLCRKLVGVAV